MKTIIALMILFISTLGHASCVILLHGLARRESSMDKLAQTLTDNGFMSVNLGYPSRDHAIELLADKAITPALKACDGTTKINFVTHSLGGILVRQYLSTQTIPNLRYVVMLSPPNKGSEVVDKLAGMPGFYWLNGDAGLQLGTDALSVPNTLGPANFNLGVIAGNQSINWILSLLIPGSDDGKVSIARTKIQGMNDHIEMPTTHPLMMKNNDVISQVIYYLNNGEFNHGSSKSSRKI